MMKRILNVLILFLSIFVFCSCNNKDKNNKGVKQNNVKQNITQKEIRESLEEVNRNWLIVESEQIDDYIRCHDLNMFQTGTGLRYQIHEAGEGDLIKEGDIVTLEYEVSLLNGDLVYSSKNDGNKTFLVGRGGVESGLEEAVLKLCKNSVATLIIPVHLAHGLIGDGNKIPPRATLIYRLKVVDKQ